MKQRLSASLAICVLLLLTVSALAQMPQPFSADMSTTSSNGNVNMKGKVFMALPKMAYMLMPEAQMYMEFPADSKSPMMQRMPKLQDYNGDPCAGREDATCKKIGTETVNGRSCDKWEATEKSGAKETFWVDQKLHFPIKSQTAGGMTTEFTNIKEGAQDPALFKVPAGYRKFDAAAMGGQRPH